MRENLRYCLQVLALPGEEQLRLYPDFVVKADELALDYDNWCRTVLGNDRNELTETQRAKLKEIDDVFSEMSDAHDSALWTEDAVRLGPEWARIRSMAAETLAAFDWVPGIPPFGLGNKYIKGP